MEGHKKYSILITPSSEDERSYENANNFNEAVKIHEEANDSTSIFSFDTKEQRSAFIVGYEAGIGYNGGGTYFTNEEKESTKKYPFSEGDDYYTVEGSTVVWSCWDDASEEMYDENPNEPYFKTAGDAIKYLNTTGCDVESMIMTKLKENSENWTTMEEFKSLAIEEIKNRLLAVPTDEQWKNGFEIFQDQPDQDPTGCLPLWVEDAVLQMDLETIDTVDYNNKTYPVRHLTVVGEEGEITYIVAPDSLLDAIVERNTKYDDEGEAITEGDGYQYVDVDYEGYKVDSEIYYYVEDKFFYHSGKEIAEKHLDIPFKFIEENF